MASASTGADPKHSRASRGSSTMGRPAVLSEVLTTTGRPVPSPFMLFTHRVRNGWAERIPAVVHVDGTARIQTVDGADEPLMHRCLSAFERRTGLPVVVNTSLNTAGRPMVDDPRDALECFGSAPVDALAMGPFLVRRGAMFARP
jgi:carbamoyltransferase